MIFIELYEPNRWLFWDEWTKTNRYSIDQNNAINFSESIIIKWSHYFDRFCILSLRWKCCNWYCAFKCDFPKEMKKTMVFIAVSKLFHCHFGRIFITLLLIFFIASKDKNKEWKLFLLLFLSLFVHSHHFSPLSHCVKYCHSNSAWSTIWT